MAADLCADVKCPLPHPTPLVTGLCLVTPPIEALPRGICRTLVRNRVVDARRRAKVRVPRQSLGTSDYLLSARSTDTNAFCGIVTLPNCFIFALPFRCFSNNFFFREMSPP